MNKILYFYRIEREVFHPFVICENNVVEDQKKENAWYFIYLSCITITQIVRQQLLFKRARISSDSKKCSSIKVCYISFDSSFNTFNTRVFSFELFT